MMMLNIKKVKIGELGGYFIKETSNPTFFDGRCAELYFEGKAVGIYGVIHPTVLEKFEIGFPCAALELNVEPFLWSQ